MSLKVTVLGASRSQAPDAIRGNRGTHQGVRNLLSAATAGLQSLLATAALFVTLTSDAVAKSSNRVMGVSLAGFVFALIWLLITLRGDSWIKHWNSELAGLEGQAGFKPAFTRVTKDRRWLPIKIAACIPWTFMFIWGGVFGMALWYRVR